MLTRKISALGYHTILTTRRIFFYGILFMMPTLPFFKVNWSLTPLVEPVYLANLLFLGLLASAFCFVTWSRAVERLGATKTAVYIYLVPVITVASSVLVLKEQLTGIAVLGSALTLLGLVVSEKQSCSGRSITQTKKIG